jgi:hypothetical protein
MACGKAFTPCPRVKNHLYCSDKACQKERKRRWQKEKILKDTAYRENRQDAQKRWRDNHRDYWREYRKSHPEYVEKNRERQRERNARRKQGSLPIAKTDASGAINPLMPGIYHIIPAGGDMIAKMDAIKVEIRFISRC